MKAIELPAAPCPHCGEELTGATDPFSEATPTPGDPTVCAYCAQICVFTESMGLREPDEEDLLRMDLVELQKVQWFVKEFAKLRGET